MMVMALLPDGFKGTTLLSFLLYVCGGESFGRGEREGSSGPARERRTFIYFLVLPASARSFKVTHAVFIGMNRSHADHRTYIHIAEITQCK